MIKYTNLDFYFLYLDILYKKKNAEKFPDRIKMLTKFQCNSFLIPTLSPYTIVPFYWRNFCKNFGVTSHLFQIHFSTLFRNRLEKNQPDFSENIMYPKLTPYRNVIEIKEPSLLPINIVKGVSVNFENLLVLKISN